jgi:hypothetical protein
MKELPTDEVLLGAWWEEEVGAVDIFGARLTMAGAWVAVGF